jgi:AcrR family transcriptional regulator
MTVFGRSGYRSGSLREIAELVGISQAGLLHHFDSKSALLTAVLYRRDRETLAHYPAEAGPEVLVAIVETMEFNTAHRGLVELYTVLAAEATAPDHPAHQHFRDRYAQVRALTRAALAAMRDSGTLLVDIEPDEATRSILALMEGLAMQWLYDPDSVDMAADMSAYLQRLVTPETWQRAVEARRG